MVALLEQVLVFQETQFITMSTPLWALNTPGSIETADAALLRHSCKPAVWSPSAAVPNARFHKDDEHGAASSSRHYFPP